MIQFFKALGMVSLVCLVLMFIVFISSDTDDD